MPQYSVALVLYVHSTHYVELFQLKMSDFETPGGYIQCGDYVPSYSRCFNQTF